MPSPFLTARWESLVFLNYRCPPELVEPLVPRGTVLDRWNGLILVSLVGFLFRDTRVRGLPVPLHRTFEEVNLRFYVRRTAANGEILRAVVFIRELVPRWCVAAVARRVYHEPYLAVPMAHRISLTTAAGGSAEYSWRYGGERFVLGADVGRAPEVPAPDSEAAFITEHYWGYTRQPDGGTLEYQVEHPQWPVWQARHATFTGPARLLYGEAFGAILAGPLHSALVAPGSDVVVRAGARLDGEQV